jgi:hypothetical protein
METVYSSEMSVDIERTTRRYIPEDKALHNHRCGHLKSHTVTVTSCNNDINLIYNSPDWVLVCFCVFSAQTAEPGNNTCHHEPILEVGSCWNSLPLAELENLLQCSQENPHLVSFLSQINPANTYLQRYCIVAPCCHRLFVPCLLLAVLQATCFL